MKNIKVNREKLYKLYIKEVSRICDLFEDKSHFTPKELIGIVSEVLEKNPEVITEKKYGI